MRNTSLWAAVFVACFASATVAAEPTVIPRRNFDHVMERADVDLGVATYPYDRASSWGDHDQEDLDMIVQNGHSEAGMACLASVRTPRYPNPAAACIVAHDEAVQAQDRDRAMIYASISCRRDGDPASCR